MSDRHPERWWAETVADSVLVQSWPAHYYYYAPPLIGGTLSDAFVWHLSCLSVVYIRPKSRTERPRKTKIGTEVAHVTLDSDSTFKIKCQGHQAALLTAVLACQAAAAVGVITCWPWETAALLAGGKRSAPTGEERGGGIPWRQPAYRLLLRLLIVCVEGIEHLRGGSFLAHHMYSVTISDWV